MLWHVAASWVVYLGLLVGALCASMLALRSGVHATVAIALTMLGTTGILFLVQRLWAYRENWRQWAKDLSVDVLHGLFSNVAATRVFEAIIIALAYKGAAGLSGVVGGSIWPNEWPLPAQLALALLVGDLGAYWLHRTAHAWGLLWRLHAVHHSAERLYVMAAARSHPLNVVLVYALQFLPLVLLGAGEEVLVLVTVFTSTNGFIQHANINLRLGPLNWIFAGPELHRWHHSEEIEESQKNFGSNIIIWDVIFGTRYLPADDSRLNVGLPDMAFRVNFLQHLAAPFTYNKLLIRLEEQAEAPAAEATAL